ncbi:MAG: hypothetical protein KBA26_13485 [Candidatus Delongbacteria bacterium]|mgnify:CR=1 FL=1|nr:hypothetical protein [Candidatus Delongbacteria bacterium]
MPTILLIIGAVLLLALLFKLFMASLKMGCGCLIMLIILIFVIRACLV